METGSQKSELEISLPEINVETNDISGVEEKIQSKDNEQEVGLLKNLQKLRRRYYINYLCDCVLVIIVFFLIYGAIIWKFGQNDTKGIKIK